ncbi:MAG: DUF1761 domain-containing protein [Gammaproteobacteria bacterium]|nr:DUF1761 domain-containing protein [Gammaproteobacteria bacterium]
MMINYWAVLVAAISAFVLGGLWYSSLLCGGVWMRESGMTDEKAAQMNPAKVYGGAFILSLLAAWAFAMFLGKVSLQEGLLYGFMAGLFWVAASFGINYLFEQRSLKLWLVNGGYHTLQFTVYGAILGAWH